MSEHSSKVGIYPIQAASRMSGIPVTTLRHWESSYGVVRPQRTEGGHRLYSQQDVQHLVWLKARIDEGLQTAAAHRMLATELGQSADISWESEHHAVMIMVAERDPITAELERHFLREEGYDVHVVLNGRDAVREAEEKQPDLIIVDVILPVLNGIKVCQGLKANPETKAIPVLIFSVIDARDAAIRAGADAFLLKPVEQPKLIEMVRDMLAASGRRVKESAT